MTNSDHRRLLRQEKAMAVVRAYRPIGHPEHPESIAGAPLRHTELAGRDHNAPGVVYFLYCAGYIKIGYTTDIKQRLNDFHTHSPMPVTLLLTIGGCPEDEENFHEEFGEERIRREWFRLSLDLRDFLSRHFEFGSQEMMHNAEDEARELFEDAREYWKEIETDMAAQEAMHQ